MIAFGSAITRPDVYAARARPGIDLVREPDSLIVEHPSGGTLFEAYNAILDRVRDEADLEALVLLHQDAEIRTPELCARVREAFADPDVGLAGCAGAVGVRSIAWWEGSVTCASFLHRYDEFGGGDVRAISWEWDDAPPYARLGEVETLDGFLLVLSPWAVRTLRFDEALGQIHGYDLDFCLQVRAAGRKVVTIDVRAIHAHALEPFSDPESWIEGHVRVAEKWEGRDPGLSGWPGTWRERALRAEAEADVARADGRTRVLRARARRRQAERDLDEMTTSVSWRLTAPLRRGRR